MWLTFLMSAENSARSSAFQSPGIAVEEKLRAQRLLFALLPLHDHAGEVGQREHRHMARPTEELETFLRSFRARHSLGGHGAFDRLCGAERLRRGL